MPNRKIFAAIVLCVFVLVMGLEWLPKQYVAPQSAEVREQTLHIQAGEDKALYEKEMKKRVVVGYSMVGYFLLFSFLLYIKILLQRSKPNE
jgi:cell division protein YceG involved in septum cleavage